VYDEYFNALSSRPLRNGSFIDSVSTALYRTSRKVTRSGGSDHDFITVHLTTKQRLRYRKTIIFDEDTHGGFGAFQCPSAHGRHEAVPSE
jgi:hypothetical protein